MKKHQNKINSKNIEKNNNDTIRLSNKTYILEDHHSKNQKIKSNRNNLPEATDKLKKLLEKRRIGSDGKRIHNNKENENNINEKKKKKKKDYKNDYEISSDYDDMDSFIDDDDSQPYFHPEVKDFFTDIDKINKIQKKHEYKGDIIESNYARIQEEEKYSRLIGRKEDEEAAKYNKEIGEDEEDDDENYLLMK